MATVFAWHGNHSATLAVEKLAGLSANRSGSRESYFPACFSPLLCSSELGAGCRFSVAARTL